VVLERLPFRLALHPDRLQKCNGRASGDLGPQAHLQHEAQRLDGGQDDHSSFEVSLLACCCSMIVVFSTCA